MGWDTFWAIFFTNSTDHPDTETSYECTYEYFWEVCNSD
jgi:hypothetical protein